MDPERFRVLLIGASGTFGQRIAAALARDPSLALILAGRTAATCEALATRLRGAGAGVRIETATLDVESASLAETVARLRPDLVIHSAGPFQGRDYRVAEAALGCRSHYVDLADGRGFVQGIGQLDAMARGAGRWAISGASSVPALTAAVVDALRPQFAALTSVEAAISPGNRTPRGLATTQAILGYVGRPFPLLLGGRLRTAYGWQSLRRLRLPGLAPRWVARCDVPDLALLPERYPELRSVEFRAGLELRRMHFGLWLASWAVRAGLVRSLAGHAPALLRLSERWLDAGSDVGIMQVELCGLDPDGRPLRRCWRIVARDGSGPQIPATAAVLLARRLARGGLPGGGAGPCLGFFTLDEFLRELVDFPIQASLAAGAS